MCICSRVHKPSFTHGYHLEYGICTVSWCWESCRARITTWDARDFLCIPAIAPRQGIPARDDIIPGSGIILKMYLL